MRKLWSAKVGRQVQGKQQKVLEMKPSDRVCSRHFRPEEVSKFYEHKLLDGSVSRIPRGKAELIEGAVPSIFEDYPIHKQPKKTKPRKDPSQRHKQVVQSTNRDQKKCTEEEITEITIEDRPENDAAETEVIVNDPPPPLETLAEVSPENDQNTPWILTDKSKLVLPPGWGCCDTLEKDVKILTHIDAKIQIDKSIKLTPSHVEVTIRGKNYENAPKVIHSLSDAQNLVNFVNSLRVWEGTGREDKPFSVVCSGATASSKQKKCSFCHAVRDRLHKKDLRSKKIKEKQAERKKQMKCRLKTLKKSKQRLLQKVQKLQKQLADSQELCKKVKKEALEDAIKSLPDSQQEAVKACFDSSKKRGLSGRRCSIAWVYECLMMRIKSPRLYNYIKENNILPVPTHSTLHSYIKNMGGGFGFHTVTLKLIEKKIMDWDEGNKRGCILIDEMKLTPGTTFNKETLTVDGITQFEDNEVDPMPENQNEIMNEDVDDPEPQPPLPKIKRKRVTWKDPRKIKENSQREVNQKFMKRFGDHALVISFQPFKGQWVQAVAAFLTRGNASANQLTHLILEAVNLLEESGLKVDAVVTDGANWNRSMWKKFGVTEENPCANHPCNLEERKLWFISDFPHLLKCMRNCMVSHKFVETARGNIDLDHWKAVLEEDSKRGAGLKKCPRLTESHLSPNFWEKMNVDMAFQFWSGSVAAGMQLYKEEGVKRLQDCQVSIDFCKMVNGLSDVLNTNTPRNALMPNSKRIPGGPIAHAREFFL
ncbi:DNA transposase [Frankliniella fusca]|uniref:DNA transposase n=1 Tax=Frankliniella fusca TaxID=407009 RepID=A0AAE1HK78_9NEOP|nr:DNA transposase [Frankliniella fusca]